MTPDRWAQAKTIFGAAIEMEGARRESYVRGACGTDRDLFEEVMSLLKADSTETMLHNPLAAPAAPGLLKSRYRVERELGRGGLGVVYLARDETLHGRPVVIKMPIDRKPSDLWLAGKFAQEVRALALIDHPGVVGALDSGVAADGRPFLVIQYIEGRSLQEAMLPAGVPLDFAARVMQQIGQALGAAHAKGIWHRDLKPANVMLQNLERGGEHVRLIDFGIATIRDEPGGEISTRVAGTPLYMAPEQFEGRVSAASDIFAMGVIVYELVTGWKPFVARHQLQLHELHISGVAVNPSQLRPGLPVAAEKLILRSLSFRPEDRPESAGDFGDDLARVLTMPPPPAASRRRALIAGLGGAALVAAGGAWWAAGRGEKDSVSWSLMVQADPAGPAVPVKAGSPLRVSDSFFLLVRAMRGGYLYLLSDDPSKDTLNTLGSFQLRAGEQNRIPEQRPFVFDGPGVLDLWCVWSPETLADLEPLGRLLNERDRGIVSDAAERARIRKFLSGLPQPTPAYSREGKEDAVRSGGPRIAWRVRVEAR
ncbi:MAG TPA: serine/threonine-protein kinase [Bryobacteraceae bacterium]|jgi:predicted Ser/Thr protein kinase|nr:serine/threonine-protein kinase [Bryobacteraceae bacterium]